MANIFRPDEVKAFLLANGHPTQYNDGLRAYLRVVFELPNASLPDLFVRYIITYGVDLEITDTPPPDPTPTGNFLLLEDGTSKLLLEDGTSFLLLED